MGDLAGRPTQCGPGVNTTSSRVTRLSRFTQTLKNRTLLVACGMSQATAPLSDISRSLLPNAVSR